MATIKSIAGEIEKIQIRLKAVTSSLTSLNSVDSTSRKKGKISLKRKSDSAAPAPTPVKAGNKGGPNKSHEIRCYFQEHGLETRPCDVIKGLAARGIEVSAALVSIARGNMLKESGASRPKKEVQKTVNESGKPLPTILTEILSNHQDGLSLKELPDLVMAAGYSYGGQKGREGLYANIYQTLHSLKTEKHHKGFVDTTPVVLLEDHKYRFNPSAKRKTA